MVLYAFGVCAICPGPLPPPNNSHARVICDRPECAVEQRRIATKMGHARRRRRRLEATEKRCPVCGETKPKDAVHFSIGSNGVCDSYCRPCRNAKNAEKYARNPAAILASNRRGKRRMMADPEAAAAFRAKRGARVKAWRQANPEKAAAQSRRYRDRVKADPERAEAARRKQLDYRRQRRALEARRLEQDEKWLRQRLPVGPVVALMERLIERERMERKLELDGAAQQPIKAVCDRAGLNERRLFAWRHGEAASITVGKLDDMLSRLGLFYWDVYNEETTRREVVQATTWSKGQRWIRGETRCYGPLIADHEALERVRQAFEGEAP